MSNTLHIVCITQLENGKFTAREQVVNTRNIDEIKLPKNTIRFQLYDRLIEENSMEVRRFISDQKIDPSPIYYVGKEYTKEQIGEKFSKDSKLYKDMEEDLIQRVVVVCTGDCFSLGKEEKVLPFERVGVRQEAREVSSQLKFL